MQKFTLILLLVLSSTSFAQQLVMSGDFPDPSVVKIGDTYWATATTSNWAPAFPILESKDLKTWRTKAHVFTTLPAWADYYFWAPEISYDNGKVYVYYSAHKRGGNLCLGVASADSPEGPYKDHGPLMCQEAGSIDGFPMRDASGKLYLVWKEDGNSVGKPTPIWAMELSEDRSKLIGQKVELFRNDAPWEANLVEGVSMIKHGEYYYAFYAGAGCCGRECSYAVGIARAKKLLGPWEKYEKNPLLKTNDNWKCPGHGTPVEHDGKYYFLYHAYANESDVYAGRQGVLSEFAFTQDGWIEFKNEEFSKSVVPPVIKDEFNGPNLSLHWQSSVFQTPKYELRNGRLALNASSGKSGTFLGHKTFTADYQADVKIFPPYAAKAGIGLIGDEKNLITVTVDKDGIAIRKLEKDVETVVYEQQMVFNEAIHLRLNVVGGKDVTFEYSQDGYKYVRLGTGTINAFYLPPWDRAVRVGLVSGGAADQKSVFDDFAIRNRK